MVIDAASKTAAPQAATLRDRRSELCQAVLAGTLPADALPALLSEAADTFLAGLLEHATQGKTSGYSLIAVGGYGRSALCPGSDLDVVLLHRRRRHVERIADGIWYTVWDTGLHLDHSVRTRSEAIEMAGSDMKVVLGLLDARHIAGDEALSLQLIEQIATLWRRDGTGRLEALSKSVTERHRSFGELAFLLEPDLKQSAGGLRDLAALRALAATLPFLAPVAQAPAVVEAEALITNVRVVVQCRSGSTGDRLVLQEQDEVADILGIADADELMANVAEAGRTIASACSEAWRRARPSFVREQRSGPISDVPLGKGIVLRAGEIAIEHSADPARDQTLALRVALAAAERQTLIERDTMDRLANETTMPDVPFDDDLRAAFVGLLATGDALIPVVEALDQRHIFERYIPEWLLVRNRPQRNAYHRYTVDRHLLEAVARAGEHVGDVARPDLLLLSALLHDIGKVGRGDHSEIGAETARAVMERLGYPQKDVEIVIDLVSMHLVLPDFATRRDLDDPSTAIVVAKAVKDRERLSLLAALTSADGQATGSAAWGPWKADLVLRLVEKVDAVLSGVPIAPSVPTELTAEQAELVAAGKLAVRATGKHVTVVAPDRPGLLAAVAGVLALNGCNVRRAMLNSAEGDMAVDVFIVEPTFDRLPDWEKVERDLQGALDGTLPLVERLAEQDRTYARGRRPASARPAVRQVTIDNATSDRASIIEVRTPDRVGLLQRIAATLVASDLDVVSALADTLGHEVVDTFYVRETNGEKISDQTRIHEVRELLEQAIGRGD
jgi:[protein-PII] uridylyltransferase